MGRDGRSNHMVEEEEVTQAADFKAEDAVVGMVKEAAEDEAK